MTPKVKAIPKSYEAPTPYLVVRDGATAIDFYKRAFGATEVMRMPGPDGKIGHADLVIGRGHVMLADESAEMGHRSPASFGGTPVTIVLYVKKVDDVVKAAVDAGARLTRAVADEFYGDRMGTVTDPFGHVWHVMTHVEDVSMEDMERRAAEKAGTPA